MSNDAELRHNVAALQQRLYQVTELNELEHIMQELAPLLAADSDVAGEAYRVLEQTCREMQKASLDDPSAGSTLLLRYLLPHLLTDNVPASADISLHFCREILATWIGQYPESERNAIRRQVLNRLSVALRDAPSENACWAVSSVGYRRDDLVAALWAIVQHEQGYSDLGDTALRVLTRLGAGKSERSRLRNAIHARMRTRITLPLIGALSDLADASSLPEVLHWWLRPSPDVLHPEMGSLALNVLTRIAAEPGASEDVQDAAWAAIAKLFEQTPARFAFDVYLGSSTAPEVDSPQVIQNLLGWLQRDTADAEGDLHRRYLLYLRASECVQPRQLVGWTYPLSEASLALLRRDACRDTKRAGLFQTPESMNKEQAWKIVLLLGHLPALTWFDEAVGSETSAYVRAYVEDLLACFRLDPLPARVREWIQQRIDLHRDNASEELAFRLGATQLAQSAASYEAFDTLVDFGVTWDGNASRDSGTALVSVATTRVRMGDTRIVGRLLGVALDRSSESWHHVAAALALQELSAMGRLPGEVIAQLEPLLFDESRELYERALYVSIFGQADRSQLDSSTLSLLTDWARTRNDILGSSAVEALARNDVLLSLPDLMTSRLGLRPHGEQWLLERGRPHSEYAAGVTGLLYWKHPEQFVAAIAAFLEELDPFLKASTLYHLLWLLEDKHGAANSSPLPTQIRNAILRQARGERRGATALSAALFDTLAQLAPDALAHEPWSHYWTSWDPRTRIALGNALGRAEYATSHAREQAVNELLLLIRDARFDVRRSAFRGLARISPDVLLCACASGAVAPYNDLRLRAAEAWSWLSWHVDPNEHSLARPLVGALWSVLSTDRERAVREAVLRGREDGRRREWAKHYWARVREAAEQLADMQDAAHSNFTVLATWSYAHALAYVGDDDTTSNVDRFLSGRFLPAHVRHWLRRLRKETEEQWEKKVNKWPEPGFVWEGELEHIRASIALDKGKTLRGSLVLWRAPATLETDESAGDSSAVQWGGVLVPDGRISNLPDHDLTIKLADGRTGRVRLTRTKSMPDIAAVTGYGSYPEQ